MSGRLEKNLEKIKLKLKDFLIVITGIVFFIITAELFYFFPLKTKNKEWLLNNLDQIILRLETNYGIKEKEKPSIKFITTIPPFAGYDPKTNTILFDKNLFFSTPLENEKGFSRIYYKIIFGKKPPINCILTGLLVYHALNDYGKLNINNKNINNKLIDAISIFYQVKECPELEAKINSHYFDKDFLKIYRKVKKTLENEGFEKGIKILLKN